MKEDSVMPQTAPPAEGDAGYAAYRAYLVDLAEKARDKARWGAPLARAARGKLSGHWSTPTAILDEVRELLRLHGLPDQFTLDVAADPGSAIAPDWYGRFSMQADRRDALAPGVVWTRPGTTSWLNPPYSEIGAFLKRAAAEREAAGALVVLAFARVDTRWFHDHVIAHRVPTWVRRGRIAFIDPITGKPGASAPAPSALMLFGGPRPDSWHSTAKWAYTAWGTR